MPSPGQPGPGSGLVQPQLFGHLVQRLLLKVIAPEQSPVRLLHAVHQPPELTVELVPLRQLFGARPGCREDGLEWRPFPAAF